MSLFHYSGPMQSLALRVLADAASDATGQLVDVTCIPGKPVELPDGHPVTVAMEAAGFLQLPPAETVETPAEPVVEIPAETPARPRSRATTQTPQE